MFQEFTGKQNLAIDVAGSFGLDKLSWQDRLDWFDANEAELLKGLSHAEHDGPGEYRHELFATSKKPSMQFAGMLAWRDMLQGRPSGYGISLDATSSGLQLLSALAGCRKSALLCNVLDSGRRENAYSICFDEMIAEIGVELEVEADVVKKAVMTALYGSEAQPKRLFGDKVDAFYAVMERIAPGAWELNQVLLSLWDKTRLTNDWILPDGFDVRVKVMGQVTDFIHVLDQPMEVTRKINAPSGYGRSLGANCIHSIDGMVVREMVRRCSYDAQRVREVMRLIDGGANGTRGANERDGEMVAYLANLHDLSGFMSARILNHLTCDNAGLLSPANREAVLNLLCSLPRKPFRVMTVHDCFRCLPNYGNDLRRTYNQILSEIAASRMLDFMTSQIAQKPLGAQQLDPEMHVEILQANYALS